jgi:hypothetical protein
MNAGKNLVKVCRMYEDAGMPALLKPGPKDAVSWNKMVVVYADETMRTIRKVLLYNAKEDKFIAEF